MARFTALYVKNNKEEGMVVFDVHGRVMVDEHVRKAAVQAIPAGSKVLTIKMGDRR